jgi:hypothetical protein
MKARLFVSAVTETLVLFAENQNSRRLLDALVLHFKNHDRWYWRDVADEGVRVYNIMFNENAERHSPLDSLIANIAASAASGVFTAIAAAMGVKTSALECAVSRWYDGQDMATPAIGLDRLRQMLPTKAEPSWEHAVLGRLNHERIVHGYREAIYPPLEASEDTAIGGGQPCHDQQTEASQPTSNGIGMIVEYETTDDLSEAPLVYLEELPETSQPDSNIAAEHQSVDVSVEAFLPGVHELTEAHQSHDGALLDASQPSADAPGVALPFSINAPFAPSRLQIIPRPIDARYFAVDALADAPTLNLRELAAVIKANIDGLNELPELDIDQPVAVPKPSIDGLDPSDITKSDTGWTWRQAVGPSEETESKVALESAGEAIAKAGYRVTARGYTATDQWLHFDAAATILELDSYEREFARGAAAGRG